MRRPAKTMLVAFALALAVGGMSVPAFAETMGSDTPWTVTFTNGSKMESNFQQNDISQLVNDMQPGDTAQITISLKNDYAGSTNWYMTNKILSSLEESSESAAGGAYTYDLSYIAPDSMRTSLFSSDTVGGDTAAGDKQGLHEVSDAMDEYFLLDTLDKGQGGQVELAISLDGETQGNSYQDTLADLSMDFGVELGPVGATRNITSDLSLPRTGDEAMARIPLYIGMAVVGLVLLIIAILGRRNRKAADEGVR